MDFVADELYDGRRVRALTIVDNFTRESIGIEVDSSIGGQRVVEVLCGVSQKRSLHRTIQVDNGPEFTFKRLDQWAHLNGPE
jgi:putative transposase